AWRLRHLRRGILKDITVTDALLAAGGNDAPAGTNVFDSSGGRAGGSAAPFVTNLFSGVPITGQLNLLTTGSFDSPKQLFTSDNFSRSIAYFSLAAPAAGQAAWSMHGALAPGAEEFLPPLDTGLWLPPQRTFSSIVEGRPLRPERNEHFAIEGERDFGASTLALRTFHQRVDDQSVTMFGPGVNVVPATAGAQLGHYFVGNAGDVDAAGWSAAFPTTL